VLVPADLLRPPDVNICSCVGTYLVGRAAIAASASRRSCIAQMTWQAQSMWPDTLAADPNAGPAM